MEAVRPTATKQRKEKKSILTRLRRSKKDVKEEVTVEQEAEPQESEPVEVPEESRAPSPTEQEAVGEPITREGIPIISSKSKKGKPSDVRNSKRVTTRNGKKFERNSVILESAPAARDAAFSGPPRYDWIDIETAAAIKVQAVFRRNKVMTELEEQGIETAAMRNKKRRRRARRSRNAANEDVPSLFQCCGMGMMFGDATEEDEQAQKAFEKAQYEEKKRQKADHEAKLRAWRPRAKNDFKLNEAVEVVE